MAGSCFTEHIGEHLQELKFNVLQNPNGILFDPAALSGAIISWIRAEEVQKKDLFFYQDLWQSWNHHSQFSHPDPDFCLQKINESCRQAHEFLGQARWLIISLGSSYSYQLNENYFLGGLVSHGGGVANCHRAPAQWFNKHMMGPEQINAALDNCLHMLFQFNPNLNVIFTVSPVRHIRDGLVENNRSKARLIESVHRLVDKFDRLFYFPAYELVIDVLRDYRFYDMDMVHPNYTATEFVLEKFKAFIKPEAVALMQEIKKIVTARKHRPLHPSSHAHKKFMNDSLLKTKELAEQYPFLSVQEEIDYFSSAQY